MSGPIEGIIDVFDPRRFAFFVALKTAADLIGEERISFLKPWVKWKAYVGRWSS